MGNFQEKAIFLWCYWDISENPIIVANKIIEGNFEAVYVHTNDGPFEGSYPQMQPDGSYKSRLNCTDALVNELRSRGLKIYGWGAPYGVNTAGEIAMMISQTGRYKLEGYVIDAEGTWDAQSDVLSDTRKIITEYHAACPGVPVAWCWWPLMHVPGGTGVYHSKAILAEAMKYADYAMPMAYWNWSSDPTGVRFLEETVKQWREVTSKPLIIAGRAYLDSYGNPTYDAVKAFDARARELGTNGITWWDAQHAVKLTGCWAALKETQKFNSSEENSMWESNALIAAFDTISGAATVDSVDFAALKAAGVHAVLLRAGTSDGVLNYDQPDASYIPNVKFGQWFRAAQAAGLRVLIDYDFNAMLDSVNGYDGSVTKRHINQLISGGLQPAKGGALILTMERNTWKQSIVDITCVSSMLAKDSQNVCEAMWSAHGLVGGIRTGRWFLDKTDSGGMSIKSQMLWMDKGEANLPLFLAYIRKNGTVVSGDLHTVLSDVPDPTITFVKVNNVDVKIQDYYLYFGNKTKWSGWEVAWIKNAAVKDSAGNQALFRLVLWNGTPAHFDEYFNFPASSDTTPPSIPGGLAASVSNSTVVLTWSPATDGVGVAGYRIYRDGVRVMDTTSLSVSFGNQSAGTYIYGVSAFDAAGNESSPASISVVVSPTGPTGDLSAVLAAISELKTQISALQAAQRVDSAILAEIRAVFK